MLKKFTYKFAQYPKNQQLINNVLAASVVLEEKLASLNLLELAHTLDSTGFQTTIMSGYYDQPKNLVKRGIKLILNIAIRAMGRHGLFFAPYIVLRAKK